MRKSVSGRIGALAAAAVTMVAPLAVITTTTSPAQAAVNDQGLSGAASPMWQTNGNVEAIVPTGGNVYVGGSFTRVRPPGAAAGTSETARTYLAALSTTTGALNTAFNVTLNGAVEDMTMSPSGNLLYIAGRFTTVNGSPRSRVAAINLPSGTLNTAFTANASSTVTSIDANGSTVYVGGDFATINGVSKSRFASLNATTGAVNTGFTAGLDSRPSAIEIVPDGSRVLVGGNFTTVNGAANAGMASVNPTTGALQTWAANQSQPVNTNCAGRVTDIVSSGTTAFVTAEGPLPGCYEGTYAANLANNGALIWNTPCLGGSLGLTVLNGVLYKASHQHDCAYTRGGARGGFVGGTYRDNFVHHYLAGQNTTTGDFVHWTPDTNASAASASNLGGTSVGPHVIETNGSQLFVGGDFTRVNGTLQQGLTRFQPGNGGTPAVPGRNVVADPFPDTVRKTSMFLPVTVQPTRAGTLTVTVPAVEDPDSGTLTYRIYRDGGTTPVSTQTVESFPWSRPVIRFDDTGLSAGSHSYRVTASDGTRTSALSTAVSGTASATAPASLATRYAALAPQLWWRLNETGPTFADSASTGLNTGTQQGGTTTGQPGAVTGNAAVTLNGTSGYVAATRAITAPNAFTESAWFRTTTVTGGTIVAQSDRATGSGGNTDRSISMDNNGGLVFAMKIPGEPSIFGAPTINVRNQGPIWNDGRWHQVTGTYDGNGTAALYVDGTLQGTSLGSPLDSTARATGMPTSFQRAGYGDLTALQTVFGINFYNQRSPISDFFAGSIDEVASFNRALTQAEVRSMFASGVAGGA
jgi:hypothetical protein